MLFTQLVLLPFQSVRLFRKPFASYRSVVVAATMGGPGVAPAAATMIKVLSEVAERYTDGALAVA